MTWVSCWTPSWQWSDVSTKSQETVSTIFGDLSKFSDQKSLLSSWRWFTADSTTVTQYLPDYLSPPYHLYSTFKLASSIMVASSIWWPVQWAFVAFLVTWNKYDDDDDQNAAACLVSQLRPRDIVTPTMHALPHWFPMEYHITYKLCLLMHHIHNGEAPVYLADIVSATSDMESCSGLRLASSDHYEIPRSRIWLRERRFSIAGPRTWNSLPARLHQIRSTVTFKRHLKSVLFQRANTS